MEEGQEERREGQECVLGECGPREVREKEEFFIWSVRITEHFEKKLIN